MSDSVVRRQWSWGSSSICGECDHYESPFPLHGYCTLRADVLGRMPLVNWQDTCDEGENDDGPYARDGAKDGE